MYIYHSRTSLQGFQKKFYLKTLVVNTVVSSLLQLQSLIAQTSFSFLGGWNVHLHDPELPMFASCNQRDFVQQSGRYLENRKQIFHNQGDFHFCSSDHGCTFSRIRENQGSSDNLREAPAISVVIIC